MKYNKSKIMKEAWSIVRACKCTISTALKRAWEKAKEDLKLTKLGRFFNASLNGCHCLFNLGDGIVSGETYYCRKILKNYGLRWNPYEKYWEGKPEAVEDLVRFYLCN